MRTANLSVNGGKKTKQIWHLCRLSRSHEHLLSLKRICEGGNLLELVLGRGRRKGVGEGYVEQDMCPREVVPRLNSSQTPDTYDRAEAHKSSGSRGHESDLFCRFCWRYSSLMAKRL